MGSEDNEDRGSSSLPSVAAAFCGSCGRPLVPDAWFCAACGAPVARDGNPVPASESSTPVGGSVARLDLGGRTSFVVQHEAFSDRWNYRVLGSDGALLFSVRGNPVQDVVETMGAFRGNPAPPGGEPTWLREIPPVTVNWDILTPSAVPWGKIVARYAPVKQRLGYRMQPTFTVFDSDSRALLSVQQDPSGLAEVGATARFPDGRVMFTGRGSVFRFSFSLRSPEGEVVGRVHEAKLSLRDSYSLDLVGNVEPLAAVLFVIILDREEQSRRARR